VAEGGDETVDQRLVADVEGVHVRRQRGELGRRIRIAAAGDHCVAAPGEDADELQPEPAVGSGDDDGGHPDRSVKPPASSAITAASGTRAVTASTLVPA